MLWYGSVAGDGTQEKLMNAVVEGVVKEWCVAV